MIACQAGVFSCIALRRAPARPAGQRARGARVRPPPPASAAALFPDGQALGQQVLAELSGQRGALERARARAGELDAGVREAEQRLRRMDRPWWRVW